ncbi:hypothetical protein THRCLA_22586 [Thraustotheca clavata]|uniref:HTH psq-type domain-containing protein n=1 Tax=Thraustotheca clavata TaxID=74557 RepID=A0A1V9YWJ6_9STRA|nr:hypothetical protein THRCLA_22586 [Thraustotheca clavata]
MASRKTYGVDKLQKAVDLVVKENQNALMASIETCVTYSTLMKYVKILNDGGTVVQHRRGLRLLLPCDVEQFIVEWITGVQSLVCRVNPKILLSKQTRFCYKLVISMFFMDGTIV